MEIIKNEEKALGAIPSGLDIRDMTMAAFTPVETEFQEEFDLTDYIEVEDQELINSCVAFSLSYARSITEHKQTGKYRRYSPGFIYANRQGTIGELFGTEGMRPRDALKNLVRHGAVLYEDFPYNDTYQNLKDDITPELLAKAYPHRISSYYALITENEVKTALMSGDVVTVMVPVYRSFGNLQNGSIIPIPLEGETLRGYHEMTIVGWRKTGYRLVNSYNESWGDKGFGILPFNFPIYEMWGITDKVNRYEEEVKQMYEDANDISKWAQEAVAECNKLGLMSGDGTNFNPKAPLTREEAAVVIYRLFQKMNK